MEWFSHIYEYINNNEGIREQNIPSFSDIENNIRKNYENNSEKEGSKELALRQLKEQQKLKEQKENPILQESKEWLDKEAMINEAKTMLYEKLWISDNQKNNSKIENFLKWIVDELVIWNYELAIEIYNTNWKVIIESLKQLASWEWIKKLAESLWESIWNLFDWNAYEKWKSVVQLWLLTTGVWLWVAVWKKWLKLWARELSKLRKPAERVVESPEIKNVVWETRWKVDEIVPKKEMDFEELSRRNIDIERQVKWLEQLWIPESFSRDLLESWLLTPLPNIEKFDLLKRYEFFNRKWVDYNKMVDDVIKKIPNLAREEALLIFSYTDYFLYWKLNAFMRWDKEILKTLTPTNIESIQKIIWKLEWALVKMPNLKPWENWFILRWDKQKYWEWKIWDEIELSAFSSVSNNKKDIFLWEKSKNDTQISIVWKEWRVKDISSLAIAVKFWDILDSIEKTINEWVILPNSRVVITDRFKLDNINYIDVEQIK